MKKTPKELDRFVDKVLAFRPPTKQKPVKKPEVADLNAYKKAAD